MMTNSCEEEAGIGCTAAWYLKGNHNTAAQEHHRTIYNTSELWYTSISNIEQTKSCQIIVSICLENIMM